MLFSLLLKLQSVIWVVYTASQGSFGVRPGWALPEYARVGHCGGGVWHFQDLQFRVWGLDLGTAGYSAVVL